MRILHLSDQFHPWMGYQETYLARVQTQMGHNVLVIASNRYGKRRGASLRDRKTPSGLHQESGIQVLRLPVRFEMPTEWAEPWLIALEEAIRDFTPDIVHSHGILSFSNIRTAKQKKSQEFGLVVDCHRAFFNTFHPYESKLKQTLKRFYYLAAGRTFGRIITTNADEIVAIGEPEQSFANWFFGPGRVGHIPIIPLGADHELFRFSLQSRHDIRSKMGWSKENIVIGHAGNITPSKDIELALQAVACFPSAEKERTILHLIGNVSSPYQLHLEQLSRTLGLESSVYFTNFVPTEELSRYMSAWDIAAWPGDISNTALEAMAVGRPIIASRTSYTEAIIDHFEAGLLFDRSDLVQLSSALLSLVESHDLRNRLGTNARKAIESRLNWKSISKEFVDLYSQILNRGPK